MKRRTFIHRASHIAGISAIMGPLSFSSFARPLIRKLTDDGKVLVLIYLQGGNDGLNTVIPLDQLSALNAVRPRIVLPENKLLRLDGTDLALHPELSGLKSLFEEERLRIIQSVGYPGQNFSHFRSKDIWMSASDTDELVNSGWTGRLLDRNFPGYPEEYPNETCPDPLAIEIGYGSTLLFQGPTSAMSVVLKDPTSFYALVNNIEDPLPDTYAGDKLKHIRITARQSQLYGEVVKTAANRINVQSQFPETDLGEQLKIVSRLIAGGLQTSLYLVTLRGFDTHSRQVQKDDHTKGKHASLLKELNDAIMAFMADLEYQGTSDRVLGMTFSEFGRRIISNASTGTDHGAAAPLFVFGNQTEPGVLGNNPVIPADANARDNLPKEYDFREIYASVLEQWFGLSQTDRNEVLLDTFDTYPVVKSGMKANENPIDVSNLQVYPNPLAAQTTIQLNVLEYPIIISLVDMNGKRIQTIYSGNPPAGRFEINWNTHQLAPGTYLLVLNNGNTIASQKVIKGNY
ncbi:MAG: hypothetical protein CSA36_01880 [Draconibacterium sp.]|nr:MAG: hypothetical protein CSA36_01880 [Draconibacterium sp.]